MSPRSRTATAARDPSPIRPLRSSGNEGLLTSVTLAWSLIVVLLLAGLLAWRKDRSLDLGFHEATGRYILQTHHWPRNDPFTYTVADHPYITMHGLFQIAVALAQRAGGDVGTSILREILILAAVALIWAHARRRGVRSPPLLILGFALGLLAWALRFFIRPELATYLALAGMLYLLRRYAEDGRKGWILSLVLVQLLWTWSHALALFGPALVGLYAATGLLTPRRRDRLPWVALGLCMAALFANPYGLTGVRFLWDLHTRLESSNAFARTVGELTSPFGMRGPIPLAIRWFEILLVLTAIVMAARLRRFSLFDHAVFVFFGVLAATALRNIGMFVVATLPLFLSGSQMLLDARPPSRRVGRSARHAPLAIASLITLLLAWTIVGGGYYAHDGGGFDSFGSGSSPAVYPIGCVDAFVDEGLRGPIYNYFNYGGYLTGRLWPREKVFIDGRLEVIGESFLSEHLAIQQGARWGEMVRRYDPNVALINSSNGRLLQRLAKDPEWGLIRFDGVASLFLRRRPENSERIAAAEERWRDLDRPIDEPDGAFLPGDSPSWLRGWLAPRPILWEPWGEANALYAIGMDRAAWRTFRESVAKGSAEEIGLVQNLASTCESLGRRREARAWYGRLLRLDPGNEKAREALGRL